MALKELFNLCRTNRHLNLLLCDDYSAVWYRKYIQDFEVSTSWKELYKDKLMSDIYVFGHNILGQLGLGYTSIGFDYPIMIPGLRGRIASAGSFFTAVVGRLTQKSSSS